MIHEGSTASTFSSAFTATLRISQSVYELKAVGEQTRDLLDTTKHIHESMGNVKIVRRQKSKFLNRTEKEWIDREIDNTVKAVEAVAALIEPARVDMATRPDKSRSVNLATRATFVLRDSPKVTTNLTKLGIATQGLNTAMGILCNREGSARVSERTIQLPSRRSLSPARKSPPSDELSEFVNRRRTAPNVQRRTSVRSKVATRGSDEATRDSQHLPSRLPVHRASRSSPSEAAPERLNVVLEHAEDSADDKSELSSGSNDLSFTETVYLDRFATTPACVPILSFDMGSPGVETWTQDALQALQHPANTATPATPTLATTARSSLAKIDEIPPRSPSMSHSSLDSAPGTSSTVDERHDMLTQSRTRPAGLGLRGSPHYPLNSRMSEPYIAQMPVRSASTPTSPTSQRSIRRKPLPRPLSDQTHYPAHPSQPASPPRPTVQLTPPSHPAVPHREYHYSYLRQTPVSPAQNLEKYFTNPHQPVPTPPTRQSYPPRVTYHRNPLPSSPPFTPDPSSTSSEPSAARHRSSSADTASHAPEVVTDSTRPRPHSSLDAPFSLTPDLAEVEVPRAEDKRISNFSEEGSERSVSARSDRERERERARKSEGGMEVVSVQRRSRGRLWLERRAGIDLDMSELMEEF